MEFLKKNVKNKLKFIYIFEKKFHPFDLDFYLEFYIMLT